MVSRREWIGMTLGAGAGMALTGCRNSNQGLDIAARPVAGGAAGGATTAARIMTRAIPSTGEMIPVVGLGTSATFQTVARSADYTALKEVMKTMVDNGARVFDTAPSYGASEEVGGAIAAELGIANKIFWATKVNVARGGTADPAAARAQIQASFDKFKVPKIDLIQVHNLADVPTQLGILKELKKEGRVRYIGVTTTSDQAHGQLEAVMRNEPIDFVGLDYAIDDRGVEATTLPLAIERKIGVLVYVPFGRNRLWQRVAGHTVPEWAKEFEATTWAQFFLKYILGNPAVTAITPATSQAKNMLDNIGGGTGKLPDAAMRARMAAHVDALPPAPGGRGGA
ncbi:MAG TPA: aldo/keto reductase [Gemmatimonadaceae bacterium]|nr:aldo/keto reductase [Gemmatimonadaceae bacterium]